jgi:alpha-L-rhamnosidase
VPTYGEGRGWRPSADRGARYVGMDGDRAVFEVGSGSWRFRSRLAETTPEPEPQVAVTAPDDVLLLAGEPRTVDLTLTNPEDRAVTVRPTATAPEGWTASLAPDRVSIPAGGQRTVALRLTADTAGPDGEVTVDAGARAATITVGVTDNPVRVATMSASSTYGGYAAAKAADGDVGPMTDIDAWNAGGGWNDGTASAYPDVLTASWAAPVELDGVTVSTLDAPAFPASRFGVRDLDVEALVDGTWTVVAQVRGNTAGVVEALFAPVRATGLRLAVLATNSGDFSRVVELEASLGGV